MMKSQEPTTTFVSSADRSTSPSTISSPSSPSSTSSSANNIAYYPGSKLTHQPYDGDQVHCCLAANGEIEGLGLLDGLLGHGGLKEWKHVEDRFDRAASTANGLEPAVKSSQFAFCIGMKESPEFAYELLRALRRGENNWKTDVITKCELHSFWCRMKDASFHSRMRIFFDLCDKNMDGKVTGVDIKQTILLSASTNKLSVTHDEAEDYAALVMELLDKQGRGYIEEFEMESLILKATLPKNQNLSINGREELAGAGGMSLLRLIRGRAEMLLRTYWRRAWVILMWLLACWALFAWKFVQYHNRTAFQVMGYCLSTAKGSAETLKLNMALILLPVCRNTITWLRHSPRLNSILPFNDNINFHKVIAGGIVVGVILHGGTHLACDFPRISGSDGWTFRQTIAVRFGYHQPSYIEILATTEVITGIAMVVLMSIAFLLATRWPRRQSPVLPVSMRRLTGYNAFWYSHHLFILVYVLLIIHSFFLFLTDDANEKTTWMYIAFPVLLYTGERILRAIRSGFYEVDILKASTYPGKVLSLKMQKPEGFRYQSGMYIFIQCPQISPFEWHPYSLTSGPKDDYLSVHIRTLGDWSYQMYNHFQEAMLSGLKGYPKIRIDGPYGSASQDHVKYDIVVLIGLGIGATPFVSILKDVVEGVQKQQSNHNDSLACNLRKGPAKAYLYWVTREQGSFDWFRDVIKETSNAIQKKPVVEMHNFLTSVYQEGDVRSALISVIQTLFHAKNSIDMVSKTPIRTHFARPNWFRIFSKMARTHRGAKIGVFYCGPSSLARELKSLCTKFSTKTTTRFVFHKENY